MLPSVVLRCYRTGGAAPLLPDRGGGATVSERRCCRRWGALLPTEGDGAAMGVRRCYRRWSRGGRSYRPGCSGAAVGERCCCKERPMVLPSAGSVATRMTTAAL